jgi:hypothetical protein
MVSPLFSYVTGQVSQAISWSMKHTNGQIFRQSW